MKRRIIAGMGANSFGMAITVFIQLVSLPLYLHYWNTSTYGVWLMLSAIPAYLSMADVGMVTAAGNKMNIAIGKGDFPEANRVFQSAQMFMMIVCCSLALLILPIIFFAPLPGLQSIDHRIALLALCAGVLVTLIFGGLSEAIFKSTERYVIGTMLSNYVRLGEWLGGMVGLITVGSFAAVAIGCLLVRLTGTFIVVMLTRRSCHGIFWGISASDSLEIQAMVKPAVSFMAFPLANALSFQGVTILVGALFGPVAVALFSTYRTIARVAVQITAIFSHALWPEFSRLFGQGADGVIEIFFRRTAFFGVIQAVCISLILYFMAPLLLRIWTHGAIEFVPTLLLLMLLYAAVGGIWHVPRVLLMATNQHVVLAYWTLGAGGLSVLLAWVLSGIFHLNGVALALLLSELFIASVCAWLAYAVINKNHNKVIIAQ
jgi:O-antigen/teichoic acid export membrane protein